MKELVSVIVPIYNVEEYLNQCVQSIRQQSYHNLEIILIDDGSPDKCGEMCDGYANEDSRVKVIHKQNGGLSDARNAGIEAATGEYITFIDSDDFIMQDMIECLMEVMNSENVDIVQCSFTRDADYAMVEKERDSDLREKYNIYSENRMVAYVKGQTIATMAWGKIYKTLLFREIRFPKGRIHEDVFTTYKLIHEANSIAVTDYIGYI